jgi:hypothetical protein
MILTLLAALTLQAPEPPDIATAVLSLSDHCLAVMTGRAEAPVGPRRLSLADGRDATVLVERGGCTLSIEDWADDSGIVPTGVRDGLLAASRHWRVTQWREREVSESGSRLRTSIVFPDIRRHSAYWVQITEPGSGSPHRLEVSYGIGP